MKSIMSYTSIPVFLSFVFFFCLLTFGCEDFVEIDPPRTEVVAETVFDTDEAAIAAITGIYSEMANATNELTGGGLETFTGLTADEFLNSSSDANRANSS